MVMEMKNGHFLEWVQLKIPLITVQTYKSSLYSLITLWIFLTTCTHYTYYTHIMHRLHTLHKHKHTYVTYMHTHHVVNQMFFLIKLMYYPLSTRNTVQFKRNFALAHTSWLQHLKMCSLKLCGTCFICKVSILFLANETGTMLNTCNWLLHVSAMLHLSNTVPLLFLKFSVSALRHAWCGKGK